MAINANYPDAAKWQPPYDGDIKAGIPDKTQAFAQWPDDKAVQRAGAVQDADARLRLAYALFENRPWRGPVPPPAPTARAAGAPDTKQDPLVAAYRAGGVDAACLNGRLEDDDALMARLAAASGWYAGTPTAATLGPGQRTQLVCALVGAFTKGIDWRAALGPDPNFPNVVYDDGLTLRNARAKSLREAADDLEARIRRVLQARGVAAIAGLDNCAALARQVRRTAISDPTLSLQPPPDVAYGSPRWLALWTGMRTLAAQGLDPDKRDVEDLIAAGYAAIGLSVADAQSQAPARTPTPANTQARADRPGDASAMSAMPAVDMGGLLLMAHAAGRIDLLAVAKGEAGIAPELLAAYYQEVFAADLRFIDALASLGRLEPPTGRRLAIANLRAAGIDPDHRVRVDTLAIPAAFGPINIRVPLPTALHEQSIQDFYLSREKLDVDERPAPDGSAVRDAAAMPRLKLGKSLKDEFDAAFDAYKQSVAKGMAAVIDASIARYGQRHGIDVDAAPIAIAQAHRRVSLQAPLHAAPLPGTRQDDDSRGYFISIDTTAGRHRYFLALDNGAEMPLPPGIDIEDWAKAHQDLVFGTERKAPGLLDRLVERHGYTLKAVASGNRAEIAGGIEAGVSAGLEPSRAGAYGASEVETLRDMERALVPFRSTYLAIREGRLQDIPGAAALDALVLVPAMGEGLALGLRAGEAMRAGIARALAAYPREGWASALKAGVLETGSRIPAMGRHAGRFLWAAGQQVVYNPLDILTLLRGGARLALGGANALIAALTEVRPALSKALSEAVQARRATVADGRWALRDPHGATALETAGPGKPADPLYRMASADDGGRLPLRRHGDRGYSRYNPRTLAPEGALLMPDAQGRLYRCLPVDVLERYRVRDASLRQRLAAERMSQDGTIALDAARYAAIDGEYVKLVADYAASTPDRPLWRIAGAPLPGARNGAPRLAWDKDLGMWREARAVPRLNGGAAQPGAGLCRLSPGDAQMRRFHDVLLSGVQGGATARQVDAVKAFLRRMESHPRGGRILRAMAAYYDIMGAAPRIVLREEPAASGLAEADRLEHDAEWPLDADALQPANDTAAARGMAAVYRKIARVDDGPAEPVFRAAIAQGKVPVDPALETAWQRWIDDGSGELRPARTRAVDMLRAKVQEARFHGGMDKAVFDALLDDAPGAFAPALPTQYRSVLELNAVHLENGLPPLPDDLDMLRLSTDRPPSRLDTLPANLQCLKIENAGASSTAHPGSRIVLPTLPDTLRELVVTGYRDLAELPHPLPAGLDRLEVSNCGLERVPALPTNLTTLALPNNRLAILPEDLPGGLRKINLSHNRLTRLPDSAASLPSAVIDIRGNPFDPAYVQGFRGRTASRIVFTALAPQDADLARTIQAILGDDHPEAAARWRAIQQAAAGDPQEAANMAEFARYLDRLRDASAYQDPAFRGEVRELLVTLAQPDRQSLRQAAMNLCETVLNVCHDRSAWMLSELRKAKLNDDILLGHYDDRVADVVDIARQMFRADCLIPIARKTAVDLGMRNEELEVQLAYAVKLRPDHALGLSAMVPDMNYFGMVRLTDQDLDNAKRLVLEREGADFDSFFVTRYEPWQSLLKRKFGERYDQAKAHLAEQTAGEAFERRVDARLRSHGMPLDDADARRAAAAAVASDMQYDALLPLTREYLRSAKAAYRPRSGATV